MTTTIAIAAASLLTGIVLGVRFNLWPDKNRLPTGSEPLIALTIELDDGNPHKMHKMQAALAASHDNDIFHFEWSNARITGVASELRAITTISAKPPDA